ncbi:MAG: cation:proton antiporter [Rhodothermales bacterium]|nr:cation:proton antiporter [Rhodothermales bacterium]
MRPVLATVELAFLQEIVLLFALSLLLTYLCSRLKLMPIVGFLLAGVIVGPSALGLVEDEALIGQLAEVGVILLLFTIGIEFSLERLERISRLVFGAGGMQVTLSIVVVTALLAVIGVDWRMGLFTAGLVALSSTTIVLTVLADRSETGTPAGQFMLAILIFQDLAIIGMVLLMPLLSGEEGSIGQILISLGKAVIIVGGVVIAARKVVPWVLERVAATGRSEMFVLTVALVCLGIAWVTSLVGVSLALGAFLAGLVVSESRFSTYAFSEMLPFRTIFNAIFFMSVGMLLNVTFVYDNLGLVLAVSAIVFILKTGITTLSVRLQGYPLRVALPVGIGLAQVGEFSFVLERAGAAIGLTPAGLGEAGGQVFIAVTVILMLATPLLMYLADIVHSRLARADPHTSEGIEPSMEKGLEDHVIVVGYGPGGQRLVRVLRDTRLPFSVIEINAQRARKAKEDGVPVIVGDAVRSHILEHAGIHTAKLCALFIDDSVATRRIVELARQFNPSIQIVARTRYMADVDVLQRAGADVVVPEELETAIHIFTHTLNAYMIPAEEINMQVNAIRSGNYGVFRGSLNEAHMMVLQGLDEVGLHTRAVAVRPGAPIAGQRLGEMNLRRTYGLTVLAVRRGDRTIGNPDGDFEVLPDDRLVMVGAASQFAACAFLFRPEAPAPPVAAEPAFEREP